MNAKGESKRAPERREIRLALGLLFGGTGLLALISLALPALSGWLQALLALMLMSIPTWVLKRSELSIDDLGVDTGPWKRTLGVSFAVMAILTPLYLAGFHVFQTQLGDKTPLWSLDALNRWDDELRHTPPSPCSSEHEEVLVWVSNDGLWILPPRGRGLEVEMQGAFSEAPKRARCSERGLSARSLVGKEGDTRWALSKGEGLRFALKDLRKFDARISSEGKSLPLALGRFKQSRDDDGELTMRHSAWWILTFLLVHIGLVALPEEWFFRGYLLARLDQSFGKPWRLLGVALGPGLIISSLAFALLHPILIPGVHRLLVFFPALLFGWLREKTGNIGAAILVHAFCNLLQALAHQFYV